MLDGIGTYIEDKGKDLALYMNDAQIGRAKNAANSADTDYYNTLWGTAIMVAGAAGDNLIVAGIGLVMCVAGLYHARKPSSHIGLF